VELSSRHAGRVEQAQPFSADADLTAVAPLVGEPSRARILLALMDGRALPASMLAAEVGLSAPATSAHLARLVSGGMLTVTPAGRYRRYALAGPEVAEFVEALARLAPARPIRSLRQGTTAQALRAARTCYDHLAGRLGVAVTDALVERRAVASGGGLGPAASEVFGALGVDVPALLSARGGRPLLRFCVDWTEQRPHLSGRLGAALAAALVDDGSIVRRPHDRAVTLTDRGASLLLDRLGLAA
jgi:DNA-binding transcriptional ArsR family regulator